MEADDSTLCKGGRRKASDLAEVKISLGSEDDKSEDVDLLNSKPS